MEGLDPTSDDYQALQAKIEQLESTISKYDELIPDIDAVGDYIGNNTVDIASLLAATNVDAAEIISDESGIAKVNVKVGGSNTVEISQEEFGDLLAARNEAYGAAVTKDLMIPMKVQQHKCEQ